MQDFTTPADRRGGRLVDRVAVVVGAGQTPGETIGNGRAIAETFAREGAVVLCVDRRPDRAGDTVSAIHASGGEADVFAADVTEAGSGDAIVEAALERWGRIDVLVNNVGIGGHGDGPAHLGRRRRLRPDPRREPRCDVAHVQGGPADDARAAATGRS